MQFLFPRLRKPERASKGEWGGGEIPEGVLEGTQREEEKMGKEDIPGTWYSLVPRSRKSRPTLEEDLFLLPLWERTDTTQNQTLPGQFSLMGEA